MILFIKIAKREQEALQTVFPDISKWINKTILNTANRIIIEEGNLDRDLEEYHDRRVKNNYDIHGRKKTQATKNKISKSLKKYHKKFNRK